jgi:hypothetical protein
MGIEGVHSHGTGMGWKSEDRNEMKMGMIARLWELG